MMTLQETQFVHDDMNRPKIKFISKVYPMYMEKISKFLF